ncbi:MAG: hypothetical protein AVDCRST_MAG49-2039 [uncultured Thermomicrobiales bacterium]|uniref:Uncharacterized protein n=1 Tax=uncultured Thermomicrobiales bacterium TaxID=1645740 RepID=A0A6J4UKI9_9BACT|nr:MAG: hypothetical protein AVDCRST_MAG49-2039 [uncultured Thermomicrobiales bacterium]
MEKSSRGPMPLRPVRRARRRLPSPLPVVSRPVPRRDPVGGVASIEQVQVLSERDLAQRPVGRPVGTGPMEPRGF